MFSCFFSSSGLYNRKSEDLLPIPEHKLIVSIPCGLHSHKPPLAGMFLLICGGSVEHLTWISEVVYLELDIFISDVF